jgi:hypothetical protein
LAFINLIIESAPQGLVFWKIMFNLFPKDGVFYQLFEKQTEKIDEAAKLLRKLLEEPEKLNEISLRLKNWKLRRTMWATR